MSAFFFNDPATTEIYTLSLHDALPICVGQASTPAAGLQTRAAGSQLTFRLRLAAMRGRPPGLRGSLQDPLLAGVDGGLIDILVRDQRQKLREISAGHHLLVDALGPRELLAADGPAQSLGHIRNRALHQLRRHRTAVAQLRAGLHRSE